MQKVRLGIDLGTTNTLAYHMKNGKPTAIRFPGGITLPSVVYKGETGDVLVGRAAVGRGKTDPMNQIRSAKTSMGDFDKTWSLRGQNFTPTDVAAEILKAVKENVVQKLKLDPDDEIEAVITVPAYFTSNQTDETRKAGERAGLTVLGILTEPRAAAIANIKQIDVQNQRILVVDIGGGTFDLSILEVGPRSYRTLATDGDRKLGGDDFDQVLARHITRFVVDDIGRDLSSCEASGLAAEEYYRIVNKILEAACTAKVELSEDETCEINIADYAKIDGRSCSMSLQITRSEFEQLSDELFQRVKDRIQKLFAETSGLTPREIDTVILAGGSCYIPKIRADIEEITGLRPNSTMDPTSMVAIGACFEADAWYNPVNEGSDIISHSLGVEVMRQDGVTMLHTLLPRGSEYPTVASHVFTTSTDNQESVEITIYEAGSDMESVPEITRMLPDGRAVPNHDLYGSFLLDNIQKAPKGVPRINVTFEYDRSRILKVTAEDQVTHASKTIEVSKGKGTRTARDADLEPVDFELLLDTSGSMKGDPLRQVIEAAERLATSILDLRTHRLGLISFGDEARSDCSPTSDAKELLRSARQLSARGQTNMTDAIRLGKSMLGASDRRRVMIIVTDGSPHNQATAMSAADQVKNAGLDILTIAAGPKANARYLAQLASKPDYAFSIENMSELGSMFDTAVRQYLANVK